MFVWLEFKVYANLCYYDVKIYNHLEFTLYNMYVDLNKPMTLYHVVS
jgi:hypothetical protein